jgi:hypothetical protein
MFVLRRGQELFLGEDLAPSEKPLARGYSK